jgi:hypothetical protein
MSDDCLIQSNGTIASAKIGGGGMDRSTIYSRADITAVQVAGDLAEGTIRAEGALVSVKIAADVLGDSLIQAATGGAVAITGHLSDGTVEFSGNAGSIQIGGSLIGDSGQVHVGGDVSSITVKGLVYGSEIDKIAVEGTASLVTIGGSVHSAGLLFGEVAAIKIGGSVVNSLIAGESSIGSVSVGRSMHQSGFESLGSIGAVTVKGAIFQSTVDAGGSLAALTTSEFYDSIVNAGGDCGLITATAGDVDGGTEVSVGGNLAGMKTAGVIAGLVNVAGDLTASIASSGTTALDYGGVLYFTDANGFVTGGQLLVDGIAPGVVVS